MTQPDNAPDIVRRVLAMPCTHRVTTTFADGTTRAHDTRGLSAAENYAVGERRKIGRDLLNRDTGATVRVTQVTISDLRA